MEIRSLGTFVLFASLMAVSRGNEKGLQPTLSSEESVDANRVSIEAKANKVSSDVLDHVSAASSVEANENSGPNRATTSILILTNEDGKIVNKLKETLEEAAPSSRAIVLSSPEINDTISMKQLPAQSLLVIEATPRNAKSSNEASDWTRMDERRMICDQENAQTETRGHASIGMYGDSEEIENIEDLLAIADYEPQKIDARSIDMIGTRKSPAEAARARVPEEAHYDVPKRRTIWKDARRMSYRTSEGAVKMDTEEPSTRTGLEAASNLDSLQAEKEPSVTQLPGYSHQSGKRRYEKSPKLGGKSFNRQWEESSREPRHLKSLRSASRASTLFPRLSGSLEEQLKRSSLNGNRVKNLTADVVASRENVPYVSGVRASAEKIRAGDHELGYLTRYNLPSLLMPGVTKVRHHSPYSDPRKVPNHLELEDTKTSSSNDSGPGQLPTNLDNPGSTSDDPVSKMLLKHSQGTAFGSGKMVGVFENLPGSGTVSSRSKTVLRTKPASNIVRTEAGNAHSRAFNSSSRPGRNERAGKVHEMESTSDEYTSIPENAAGSRYPQGVSMHRTGVPSSAHMESSGIETEKVLVNGSWKKPSSMTTVRNYRELQPMSQQNTPSSRPIVQDYHSRQQEGIIVEPTLNAIQNGFATRQSANYGNRVEALTSKGIEGKPRTVPAYPMRSETLAGPRNPSSRVAKVESAESIQRVDVLDQNNDKEGNYEEDAGLDNGEKREESKQDEVTTEENGEQENGQKHEEDHYTEKGEKGEKGYESWQENEKGAEGHRDEESHEKDYDEKKGDEKSHEDASGYHEEHRQGEKGTKASEFDEKDEHQKGHSTKGQHVIHEKDEYEKNTEFYDESHEEDGDEKEGDYRYDHDNEKAGHEKSVHRYSADDSDVRGETFDREKAQKSTESKGHEDKGERERHHRHHEIYGKEGKSEGGKIWSDNDGGNNGKA